MATKSEQERLAVVETKLDVLSEQVKGISDKLDLLLPTYVTKDEHEKTKATLELEIQEAKRKSGLFTWITSTLAAVFAVIMTILVQNYFGG